MRLVGRCCKIEGRIYYEIKIVSAVVTAPPDPPLQKFASCMWPLGVSVSHGLASSFDRVTRTQSSAVTLEDLLC